MTKARAINNRSGQMKHMAWNSEQEAREAIKQDIAEYYRRFMIKPDYVKGNRIQYAGTVFDEKEMCAVTDA